MGLLGILKRRSKVSKGFNVIIKVSMTDKLSLLDYSLQILNEINLPMVNHLVCLGFFNLS